MKAIPQPGVAAIVRARGKKASREEGDLETTPHRDLFIRPLGRVHTAINIIRLVLYYAIT